ncbi:precorrin-2 dehydrogenase/sirohydrochlorin ferrochelatase family protein [Novosphingobium terrae]|uniref:precorrin-2 dehydrogenase/sirohydrochlorin ferrochelatase family protein n=1 Tax=Novosphingobium terrae TaxID=2726189 RepID=UPI00198042FA|nr:bifunctional precorrin-2 dehydrogenase/sirohydrochlorin ferrochelatase [Novosphingobium terrae]
MIENLPLFHRIAGQPIIVLGEGDAAEPKRRLVERAGGVVHDTIAEGLNQRARLAFVAHTDRTMAEQDAQTLREAGVLVNVVDQPDLCDFTVPSILDRSPVLVAVGTGGASAGLAKALRLRLEQILPPGLGALARALGEARAGLRALFPDVGERRRALDAALSAGGPLDPLSADASAVAGWLGDPASGVAAGVVEIRLRSDDPDDLTLREARLLGSADVVCHEPGVPLAVLDRARADALRQLVSPGAVPEGGVGLWLVLRR